MLQWATNEKLTDELINAVRAWHADLSPLKDMHSYRLTCKLATACNKLGECLVCESEDNGQMDDATFRSKVNTAKAEQIRKARNATKDAIVKTEEFFTEISESFPAAVQEAHKLVSKALQQTVKFGFLTFLDNSDICAPHREWEEGEEQLAEHLGHPCDQRVHDELPWPCAVPVGEGHPQHQGCSRAAHGNGQRQAAQPQDSGLVY